MRDLSVSGGSRDLSPTLFYTSTAIIEPLTFTATENSCLLRRPLLATMEGNEFWQFQDVNRFPAAPYFEYDFTAEEPAIDYSLGPIAALDFTLPFEQHEYSAIIDPALLQTFDGPAFALPYEQDRSATIEFAPPQTSGPPVFSLPSEMQDRPVVSDQNRPGQSFASDPEPPAAQYDFFFRTC